SPPMYRPGVRAAGGGPGRRHARPRVSGRAAPRSPGRTGDVVDDPPTRRFAPDRPAGMRGRCPRDPRWSLPPETGVRSSLDGDLVGEPRDAILRTLDTTHGDRRAEDGHRLLLRRIEADDAAPLHHEQQAVFVPEGRELRAPPLVLFDSR